MARTVFVIAALLALAVCGTFANEKPVTSLQIGVKVGAICSPTLPMANGWIASVMAQVAIPVVAAGNWHHEPFPCAETTRLHA